jgi:hypothetical protein
MAPPTQTWNYSETVTCFLVDQSRYIGNIVSQLRTMPGFELLLQGQRPLLVFDESLLGLFRHAESYVRNKGRSDHSADLPFYVCSVT